MFALSRRTLAAFALAGGLSAGISLATPISAFADDKDVAPFPTSMPSFEGLPRGLDLQCQ
jgi:hypothetical protein